MKCSLVSLLAIDYDKIPEKNIGLIIEILNKLQDSDLVLFSGWTLPHNADLNNILKNINFNNTFVLEVGSGYFNRDKENSEFGFYVVKGRKIIKSAIKQIFMDSNEANNNEDNLIKTYLSKLEEERLFNVGNKNVRLIICGENNILRNKQKENNDVCFRIDEDDLINQFQFIIKDTDIFLNSAHTPMGNLGKLKKRWLYLSQNNRICLFTTNEETAPNIKSKPKTKNPNLHKSSLQYIFVRGEEKSGNEEINNKYKITTIEIN
jgi:hypothetical protein